MIAEIKFRDEHPILKGLLLNFEKQDRKPYKTIIIAGENGTGKTTIFESLDNFFNNFKDNVGYKATSYLSEKVFNSDTRVFEYMKYVDATGCKNVISSYLEKDRHPITDSNLKNDVLFRLIFKIKKDGEVESTLLQQHTNYDICKNGFAYIPARSMYKSEKITHITTHELDINNRINDTSATNIKQLLVDIFAHDAIT